MAILAVRDLPGTGSKAPCGHSRPCGCKGVSECCLDCHLPVCRDEFSHGMATIRAERTRMLILDLRQRRASVRTIANTLRVSKRTVFRVLEEA